MMNHRMKKRAAIIPAFLGPPYAIIPSYITAFQSSPVMIYVQKFKPVLSSIKSLDGHIMNFLFSWKRGNESTWNTVNTLVKKLSKWCLGLWRVNSSWTSSNLPPKSCAPSNAKMKITRKRSRSKDRMASIEFMSELKRSLRAFQYL